MSKTLAEKMVNRRLIKAAGILKEAAMAAPPGPYWTEIWPDGTAWVNVNHSKGRHAFGLHGFPDGAKWVELMDPHIGLAVAHVLEQAAEEKGLGPAKRAVAELAADILAKREGD